MTTQEEILSDIKNLRVDCPDCHGLYDDDQYTCTTCWHEGGNGSINVFDWLQENPEVLGISKPTTFNPLEDIGVTIETVNTQDGYYKLKAQYINELFYGFITVVEFGLQMDELNKKILID
jgi:DNA-directed RNA polymerase subunit RPC12/RpoP